jgi:hypothetical protein
MCRVLLRNVQKTRQFLKNSGSLHKYRARTADDCDVKITEENASEAKELVLPCGRHRVACAATCIPPQWKITDITIIDGQYVSMKK